MPRNGATSIVWTCFGFRASDVKQEHVICKESNKVVSAPQSNTTNLFNHLKKHHKPKYEQCMKAKAYVNSQNPRPCPAPTQTTITATLQNPGRTLSIYLPKTRRNNRRHNFLFGQRHVPSIQLVL